MADMPKIPLADRLRQAMGARRLRLDEYSEPVAQTAQEGAQDAAEQTLDEPGA